MEYEEPTKEFRLSGGQRSENGLECKKYWIHHFARREKRLSPKLQHPDTQDLKCMICKWAIRISPSN